MGASERKDEHSEQYSDSVSPLDRQALELKKKFIEKATTLEKSHDEEKKQGAINREDADKEFAIIRMHKAIAQLCSLLRSNENLAPAQANFNSSLVPRYDRDLYPEAIRLLYEGSRDEINSYSFAMEKACGILQKLSSSLGPEQKSPFELPKKDFVEFLTAITQLDGQASQCPSSRKAIGAFLMIAGAIAIAVALGPIILAAVPHVLAGATTLLGTSATASVSAAFSSAIATVTHSVAGSYLISIGSYLSSLGTTYMGTKAVYAAGLLGKLLAQSPVLAFAGGVLGVKLRSYISDTEAKPAIKYLTDIYKKTQTIAKSKNPDMGGLSKGKPADKKK